VESKLGGEGRGWAEGPNGARLRRIVSGSNAKSQREREGKTMDDKTRRKKKGLSQNRTVTKRRKKKKGRKKKKRVYFQEKGIN